MQQAVASTPHGRRRGRRLIAAGLGLIAVTTLLPNKFQASSRSLCVVCGDTGLVDVILNILLFMPLGAGLARLGLRRTPALLGMAALSAVIEGLQYSVISGRDSSLGDFLMNSAGGALGYLLVAESQRWSRPSRRTAARLAVSWAAVWLLVQSVASYAIKPLMTESTVYGQITRSPSTPFPGVFLGASIGGERVPDTAFPDSRRIERLLGDNSTVTEVRVIAGKATPRPSGIVRIADRDGHELMVLQQSRDDLIFSLRTRTAALRLRPLYFRLRGAFAERFRGDTVLLSAQYGQKAVTIAARGTRDTVAAQFQLTPAYAWAMVFPFEIYFNGSPFKALTSCLWIAALVFPIGYWSWWWISSGTAQAQRRDFISWLVAGSAALLVGLAIIPMAFGLSSSPFNEWLAGGMSLAFSARAASRIRT
jgi:hypothetical protein